MPREWHRTIPSCARLFRAHRRRQGLRAFRVHFEDRDRELFFLGIGIHTDDLAHTQIDLALVTISRIGDLALEESFFNGRDHTAQFLHPAEIIIGLLFHAVCLRFDEETAAQRVDGICNT